MLLNLVVVLVTIAVCLVLTEIVLRLFMPQPIFERTFYTSNGESFWRPSSLLGWESTPNASGMIITSEFSIHVDINSDGLRDRDHALSKPANITRILVLGDSSVFGNGVDTQDRFTDILQDKLGLHYEVINMGVTGYGTDQEYLLLREKGLRYAPDIVILVFHENDLLNNYHAVQYGHEKPLFVRNGSRLVLTNIPVDSNQTQRDIRKTLREKADYFLGRHLHTYMLFRRTLLAPLFQHLMLGRQRHGHVDRPLNMDLGLRNPTPQALDAMDMSLQLVKKTQRLSEDANASFLFLNVPLRYLVENQSYHDTLALYDINASDFDYADPYRRFREFSEKENVSFYDLVPVFRNSMQESLFFAYDQHWSAAGHALVAQSLYDILLRDGYLHR